MAFNVTQAFYRLIEAKENLKVALDALKQRQEFLTLTEAFFKAGKITNSITSGPNPWFRTRRRLK